MSDPKAPRQRQEEAALFSALHFAGRQGGRCRAISALVHLRSKRAALNSSSLYQMVLMEEFHQLANDLAQSPSAWVLIDKSTLAMLSWQAKDRGLREFVELLQGEYQVAAATPTSYLFGRRSDEPMLLDGKDERGFHISVRKGASVASLTFPAISTKTPWTVEMIVKPAAVQSPNAVLLGNHPGLGQGGFVVQQDASGLLALNIGNGKARRNVLQFHLQPDQWNYLAVVHSENVFVVYRDGEPVASAASDFQIQDSPLPLQFGDWLGYNRPFKGAIKEVRLSHRVLAPSEIAAAARSIREKLH